MKKLFGVFLMLALLLIGCGKKEKVTEINFLTNEVGVAMASSFIQEQVEKFNKNFEGQYKVVIEGVPGDEALIQKINTMMSANDLPDIFVSAGRNYIDIGNSKGNLVDLKPYLDADPEWKKAFTPEILKFLTRDNKILGLHTQGSTVGYWYNKELFKEAGIKEPAKTWNELFEQAEKLKSKGIIPFSMDTGDTGWLTSLWLSAFIGTSGVAGNKFMHEMYPKNYNNPEFLDATKAIQKMLEDYTTLDAIGGLYNKGAANFLQEKTAMIANGPWMISDFYDQTKTKSDNFYEKVGAAIYPKNGVFGGDVGYEYYVGAKTDEEIKGSIEFLKQITGNEGQLERMKKVGSIPISPSLVLDNQALEDQPLLADLLIKAKNAEFIFPYYQQTWYLNVLDTMSKEYPSLAQGDITAKEFANRLTTAAQKNK